MKIHLVGGAVRDEILGLPVKDRDWVVVGATPQQMLDSGFRSVGADFPVFLHPQSNEEYALARTERKTGPGYAGFAFHADPAVTLEEDLGRRDLTINAMAKGDDGRLIDPHGGALDLKSGIFRHIGPSFAEDPVRILRVARLAARYPRFKVAAPTLALMKEMVRNGEIDALVPERIWKEVSRGLEERQPSRMIQVLRDCGALARLLPELDCLYGIPAPAQWHPEVDTGIHIEMAVDHAAKINAPLAVRFATLLHDLGKGLTEAELLPRHPAHEIRGLPLVDAVCKRWKVPNDIRELARLVTREHGNVHASTGFKASPLMRLLDRCGAVKHPERFDQFLLACECDARGRLGLEDRDYFQVDVLRDTLAVALSVDTKAVVARAVSNGVKGKALSEAIQQARVVAIQKHQLFEGAKSRTASPW